MKEFEVEVYDSKNKNRLLGYVSGPPPLNPSGYPSPRVSFATYKHAGIVSCLDQPMIPSLGIDIVDLFIEWRVENDGYTRQAFFTTNTPLEHLGRVREFRFPGEDWWSARRRCYYGYGD